MGVVQQQAMLLWLVMAATLVPTFCSNVWAEPETWIEPILSLTGNSSSGFGASVACSGEDPEAGHSWYAVGAPDEASGQGRVHILNTNRVVQTLQSTSPGNNKRFGYFVSFIRDVNGDSINELVVGEPNPSGANGYLHVYLSTADVTAPFIHCTSVSGSPSFGSHFLQTVLVLSGTAEVVVGAPTASPPRISTHRITYDNFAGTCDIIENSVYGSAGDIGSRYGQSIGEIDTGATNSTLLIGAPGYSSSAGGLYQELAGGGATRILTGAISSQLGGSIASRFGSSLLAFTAPFGTNTLSVQDQNLGSFAPVCDLQVPMSNLPPTTSQSLVHAGSVFDGFVGISSGSVFASYKNEVATGGSVVLFGVQSLMCTSLKQINNCVADPNQKQGVAIAAGSQCYWTEGANVIVVGSPGFSSNAGRVDIYAEHTESESAAPCSIATNTPTATPTATATVTPVVEQIVTPEPGFGSTPILVDPGTSGLPAPTTTVAGKHVTVVAPLLQSRRLKLLGYLFALKFRASRQAVLLQSSVRMLRADGRKREIFSRRNQISLRNLTPGSYVVSYRPVFQSPKSRTKRILGKTSAQGTFSIR
jgi:hypothetical protein